MVQIMGSGRTVAGAVVAFDIEWDGDLSSAGSVLWSMEVSTSDGTESVDLGYQRNGGAFAAQFVDDPGSGRRVEVPEDADLGDGQITVRFPANVVGVAAEWPVWRAVVVVDGSPVASEVVAVS
jgi:hypothetical protein